MIVDMFAANLFEDKEQTYADAWKKACETFNQLCEGSSQLAKLVKADEAAWTFLQEFEALMILYGDPTKAGVTGTINMPSKGA